MLKVSRQVSSLAVAASSLPTATGRATRGNTNTAGVSCAATSVVCARKPLNKPACCASPNTALTAASTSGVLRRVWSQASALPSNP